MEKLMHVDATDEHKKTYGSGNDAPPGWEEISVKELVQKTLFSSYNPEVIDYRQILRVEGKPLPTMLPAKLLIYHDGTGVGIVCDYWGEKVTYYRFGCRHEYHELSYDDCCSRGIYHAGRCYHVSECSKCGHINAADSSD